MNESHQVYLNLGSNIQPEINLVKAVELLHEYGEVKKVSNAWESEAVGMDGPNYLNACVLFLAPYMLIELKDKVIRPIESQLGRLRQENKYAPRTIDIDIILFDEIPFNLKVWGFAFVIIPLEEIHSDYKNPTTNETVSQTAARIRQEVWMVMRPKVLSSFTGGMQKS